MEDKKLTEREQKVLDYIKAQIKAKGYPPTIRELCQSLDIKSTSTAHKDLDSLMRNISMVFQNVYLFEDTIENNIKFGKTKATLRSCRTSSTHMGRKA